MNRRVAIVTGALAALGISRPTKAVLGGTCPAPVLYNGNPVFDKFTTDLRHYSKMYGLREATVFLDPRLAQLAEPINTVTLLHTKFTFIVVPPEMGQLRDPQSGAPALWGIVPLCGAHEPDGITPHEPFQLMPSGLLRPVVLAEDAT